MTRATVHGVFVTWTRGGTIAVLAGLAVLALGQVGRVSLGQSLWFLGNALSAMTIWAGGLWIVMVLVSVYGRQRTSLIVSENGVELNSGIFRRQVQRIEASKIESVTTGQSLLGGQKYGIVKITGSGKAEIEADALANFLEVAEAVRGVSSAASPKGPRQEAQVVGESEGKRVSLTDALNNLGELRERGLLSDSEFEVAKKRVLEG